MIPRHVKPKAQLCKLKSRMPIDLEIGKNVQEQFDDICVDEEIHN